MWLDGVLFIIRQVICGDSYGQVFGEVTGQVFDVVTGQMERYHWSGQWSGVVTCKVRCRDIYSSMISYILPYQ